MLTDLPIITESCVILVPESGQVVDALCAKGLLRILDWEGPDDDQSPVYMKFASDDYLEVHIRPKAEWQEFVELVKEQARRAPRSFQWALDMDPFVLGKWIENEWVYSETRELRTTLVNIKRKVGL